MSKKFPYGYDVNAYIDKAFEQMKQDFPWATREMIAENTNLGIEKVGDDYQYVSYHSQYDGTLKPYPEDIDCEEFLHRLASGRDWELQRANPVKERIDVEATNGCLGDWYLVLSDSEASVGRLFGLHYGWQPLGWRVEDDLHTCFLFQTAMGRVSRQVSRSGFPRLFLRQQGRSRTRPSRERISWLLRYIFNRIISHSKQ